MQSTHLDHTAEEALISILDMPTSRRNKFQMLVRIIHNANPAPKQHNKGIANGEP